MAETVHIKFSSPPNECRVVVGQRHHLRRPNPYLDRGWKIDPARFNSVIELFRNVGYPNLYFSMREPAANRTDSSPMSRYTERCLARTGLFIDESPVSRLSHSNKEGGHGTYQNPSCTFTTQHSSPCTSPSFPNKNTSTSVSHGHRRSATTECPAWAKSSSSMKTLACLNKYGLDDALGVGHDPKSPDPHSFRDARRDRHRCLSPKVFEGGKKKNQNGRNAEIA